MTVDRDAAVLEVERLCRRVAELEAERDELRRKVEAVRAIATAGLFDRGIRGDLLEAIGDTPSTPVVDSE